MDRSQPGIRWAIRAHIDGALDFSKLRRYNRFDALKRTLVYQEYASREALGIEERRAQYLGTVLARASDTKSTNKDFHAAISAMMNYWLGKKKSEMSEERVESLKKLWENTMGIKWGSPEFRQLVQENDLRSRYSDAMQATV